MVFGADAVRRRRRFRFERTRPRVRAVEGRVRLEKRRLRPHAFGGGRRRELRRPVRRRVARAAAGLVGVPRRQLRRGAAGDRERDGRALDVAQDDVRRSGGVTRFNETWYAPVAESSANATNATGGAEEPCRSSNDVSAQAMAPVDFARFKRDPALCPNRRLGRRARRRLGVARVLARDDARDGGDARVRRRFFRGVSRSRVGGDGGGTGVGAGGAAPRAPGRAAPSGTRSSSSETTTIPVREICRPAERGLETSDLRRASRRGALVVSNAARSTWYVFLHRRRA